MIRAAIAHCVLAFSFVASPAQAQDALTLDRVLRSVAQHHPSIEAARHELRASRAERDAADGGFDPVLSATAAASALGYYEWGRVGVEIAQPTPLWGTTFYGGWRMGTSLTDDSSIPPYYGQYETLDGGELRLGVRVPLWQDGPIDARRARQRRAEHGERVEARELDGTLLATRVAAAHAYYRWVASERKLQIATDLLRLAEARDTFIRARVAAGAVAPIEELENRRVILVRRAQVVASERGLERSAIALSLFLRDRRGEPWVPSRELVPESFDVPSSAVRGDVELALARRPEIERAEALLERQRVSVEQADNRVGPRIDLAFEASTDLGGGSEERQTRLGPAVLEGSLVVSIPIPLRDARGSLERENAMLSALREEARLVRDRVSAQVRDAISAWRAADASRAIAGESAEVAEQVAEAERRRFELGATGLFVVNLREQAAAEARAAYVDAQADVAIAAIEQRAAIGDPSLVRPAQ